MPRRAEKIRMLRRVRGLLCGAVVLVLATLAPIFANATPTTATLTVNNSVASNSYTFTLLQCTNSAGGGATSPTVCGGSTPGQFTITGVNTISITGNGGGAIEGTSVGYVDTFLEFAVTAPLAATVGFTALGCGDNPGVSNTGFTSCSGSTNAVKTGTTINAYSDAGLTINIGSASANFSKLNPDATSIGASAKLSNTQTTFYVTMDLAANSSFYAGTAGYAAFDSVVVSAPEPTGVAVFAVALAGFGLIRRRRLPT